MRVGLEELETPSGRLDAVVTHFATGFARNANAVAESLHSTLTHVRHEAALLAILDRLDVIERGSTMVAIDLCKETVCAHNI